MRATDAAVAARWLRDAAIPALRAMPGTILGGGYGETIVRLEQLAGSLADTSGRKRGSPEFSTLIEVADAAAFVRAVSACRPAWPLRHSPAIVRLAVAMQNGGKAKRRGRHSLTKDEVALRVAGGIALDDRHRKRLVARRRRDAAGRIWVTESLARGETILTSTVPFPKI
ncbi:hypothetical protein [Paracoccus cavernae]